MMGRMENLQKEIEALEKAEPPESYSTDTITDWLTSIKEAPTPKAIKLLIERIEVTQNGKKLDLRVESTLKSILKMVAGEIFIEYAHEKFPFLLGRKCTFDIYGAYLSVI